jgi:hypothetical protein
MSESGFDRLTPQQKKAVYIGVPVLIALVFVYWFAFRSMAARNAQPGAIDHAAYTAELDRADREMLAGLSVADLKAQLASRQDDLKAAELAKIEEMIPQTKEAIKRVEEALKAKQK